MKMDPVLLAVATVSAAMLFGIVGASKLTQPNHFREVLTSYRLLPESIESIFAMTFPLTEIAVAVGLLFDLSRSAAAVVGSVLLLLFFVAVAINLARGNTHIACGCWAFDHPDSEAAIGLSGWTLMRIALLGGLLVLSSVEGAAREMNWLDYISVTGGSLAVVGFFFAAELLATNRFLSKQLDS